VDVIVRRAAATVLPTRYGRFDVFAYTVCADFDPGEPPPWVDDARGGGPLSPAHDLNALQREHLALVRGNVDDGEAVLVRVHSECMTGDVFGSLRCDCGEQLEHALRSMDEAGRGVLLYMRQEGRGIGLTNKLRAYALQDAGHDTVEANQALGFCEDGRDYAISAGILLDLGVRRVELMTNNPRKIIGLEEGGVSIVRRVPILVSANEANRDYLATKRDKMGHLLKV
jgi:3,4-dihydroxy 2-butanone 4-phosphate synthase/GTP cyclohydrolase II